MRVVVWLVLVLVLVACGTSAQQVESAQASESVRLTMFAPTWDCHVDGDLSSDGSVIEWRASDACGENRIIPFEIVDEGGHTIMDGGVYAHNVTVWFTQRQPGTYRVVHGQHGGLIAEVLVE